MIVKDEEEFLPRCLDSIRDLVDEMIIVDTGSTDRTVEIAESYGATIYHHPWQGSFSEARNFGLQYATCDWILQMDADEELEREDIPVIKKVLGSNLYNAVSVALLNDSPEGWSKHYFQRIFRRGKAYYQGIVHNQLKYEGKELRTEIRIYHYGYNLSEEKMAGKFRRTETLLREQIEHDPTSAFSHQNLIRVLRAQKRFEDAVAEGMNALEVCKDRMNEYNEQMISYDLAYSLMLSGRRREAETVCRDVLSKFPKNLDLQFTLGAVLFGLRRFGEALEVFQQFIEINQEERQKPKPTQLIVDTYDFAHKCWGCIADCYYELDRYDESVEAAQKAISLRPALSTYKITLARSLIHKGLIDEAGSMIEKAGREDETNAEFFLKWVMLCKKEPQLGDPEQVLQQALKKHPESEELHNCLAYTVQHRDAACAEAEWKKTLEINPGHLGAHAGLVRLLSESSARSEWMGHAEVILERAENIDLLKEVGACCLKHRQYNKAIDFFSKVLDCQPEDIKVLSDISTCYARLGQVEAALIGYREVLRMNPGDETVRKNFKVLEQMLTSEVNG